MVGRALPRDVWRAQAMIPPDGGTCTSCHRYIDHADTVFYWESDPEAVRVCKLCNSFRTEFLHERQELAAVSDRQLAAAAAAIAEDARAAGVADEVEYFVCGPQAGAPAAARALAVAGLL